MASIITGKGFCSTAATTAAAVEATAQLRYVRVNIYNADTIQHIFNVNASSSTIANGKTVKQITLQANEQSGAGPYSLLSTDMLLVQQAEATSATTSTWLVVGEF